MTGFDGNVHLPENGHISRCMLDFDVLLFKFRNAIYLGPIDLVLVHGRLELLLQA